MKYKLLEILGWIRYFFTRKRCKIVLTDEVKEFLAGVPDKDLEEILKALDKLSKNPHIGRPIE